MINSYFNQDMRNDFLTLFLIIKIMTILLIIMRKIIINSAHYEFNEFLKKAKIPKQIKSTIKIRIRWK